jgi:hypothetical protein
MLPEDDPDPLEYLEKLDNFLEGKEQTTLYFELEKMGCAPPLNHEQMSDEEVLRALTDLIWGLYELHVIVDYADHLADRPLYVQLLGYCDEPTVVFPNDPNAWCHWSADDDDWEIYLRYYADDEARARSAVDYPDTPVPPKELPPYYRSWLPWRDGLGE